MSFNPIGFFYPRRDTPTGVVVAACVARALLACVLFSALLVSGELSVPFGWIWFFGAGVIQVIQVARIVRGTRW